LGEQAAGECGVADGGAGPEVKAGRGALDVEHAVEDVEYGVELLPVQAPVLDHMLLVAPGDRARVLVLQRHGAAVVGPIGEEALDDLGVAGDETGAQPRRVGAL
jgi:hypothetical protein